MKRAAIRTVLATGVLMVVGAMAVADPPRTFRVEPVSRPIMPARQDGLPQATAWRTNTVYTWGQMVQVNQRFYWCVYPGTSTNAAAAAPSHLNGEARDGTCWWLRYIARPRKGFAVVNLATNAVYLAEGYPAIAGTGIALTGYGSSWNFDANAPQGPIYAISAAPKTNQVTILEWLEPR